MTHWWGDFWIVYLGHNLLFIQAHGMMYSIVVYFWHLLRLTILGLIDGLSQENNSKPMTFIALVIL